MVEETAGDGVEGMEVVEDVEAEEMVAEVAVGVVR